MIGESALPVAARTARTIRLFKRAASLLIAVIGLIALGIGITLIRSQNWPTVTGTVQSCVTVYDHHGPTGTGTRTGTRTHQECVVNWVYENREHTAKVNLGSSPKYVGNTAKLRVHGDNAVDATPAWLGYVTGAVGVLLVSAGIIVALRTRRSPR
jgi:hypothetical protein